MGDTRQTATNSFLTINAFLDILGTTNNTTTVLSTLGY